MSDLDDRLLDAMANAMYDPVKQLLDTISQCHEIQRQHYERIYEYKMMKQQARILQNEYELKTR